MKIVITALFFFMFFNPVVDCEAGSNQMQEVKRAFHVMGTSLEFHLLCGDKQHCHNIINDSIKEVNRIDKVFSDYRDDSELSRLEIKTESKIQVSEEFLSLTKYSIDISRLTNGAFDISVGPLVSLWREESKKDRIPALNTINKIKDSCVGFNKLKLHQTTNEIEVGSDCIELDFGAIGKGYVLKQIVDILLRNNIENGLINFGGNIYALGNDEDDKAWTIKIKDPDNVEKSINKIIAKDISVSTSGGYERYFEVNGKRYSHIIDPRTGYPVKHFTSVTVISSDPILADALSTAFSVLNLNESKKIINQLDMIGVLIIQKKGSETNRFNNKYFDDISLN